ncbi:MAG: alpha-2-macroglobulin family protein [Pseudomonadota bacterium]
MRLLSFFAPLCAVLFASVATAQDVLPQHRYVMTRDVDFFGADRANLFDTTLTACQRACSADAQCVAFTFNTRSNACFPKSAVNDRQPYVGAISANRVDIPQALRTGAAARAAALGLGAGDRDAALAMARDLPARFPVAGQTPQDLIAAADAAWARGDGLGALRWTATAIALTDAPDLWVRYAEDALRLPDSVPARDRRTARAQALPAALNGFLRAETPGGQVTALTALARAYERNGRGRDMIAPLRLAQSIQPRDSTDALLDTAIGKYGFRITDHSVDNQSEAPRICATFSEDLVQAGLDYDPYVRSDAALVPQVDDRQLCLDGARHGQRYQVTFRSGLPAANGEALAKDVTLSLYVRDRAPAVRFPGRAYVLGRGGNVALPVETVNLTEIDLRLSRVSDRNIVRALRDDLFGRPLSQWQEEQFDSDIGQEVWRGTGTVSGPLNVEARTRLPLTDALAGQGPGIYVLSARVPGSDPYDQASATQWFVLSDLGVTTWQGTDGLTAAVRALTDAGAVAGAAVTLISRANAVLGTVQTDADGFASFAPGLTRGRGGARPAMLQVATGDDFVFLPLTDPAFDLSDRGVEGRPPAPPIDVFLTTDRGAYRPGVTVHVTALARDPQAAAVPALPLTAILYRPDGVEYSRQLSPGAGAGGHVIALPLGANVPRGTWRIDLLGDLDAPPLATNTVLVEDFVPERIDVTLDIPQDTLTPNASSAVRVQADYLFGAPGSDLPIEGELRLTRRDSIAAYPGYRFGRHDTGFAPRQSFLSGGRTDTDGSGSLTLDWPEIDVDDILLDATVTARVSDGAGRPVERSITRPVAAQSALIGIKPAFDDTLPEGAEARFDLIATDAMPVRWTINRVETRYQWYQLYGNWEWEPITKRTRIAAGEATLSETPTSVATATDWGQYEIVVERTNGVYTASSFGFNAGWYGAADGTDTPDLLPLSLDSKAYAPGDTATLRLDAPYDGTALISVLGSDVIERRAIPVTAGDNTVALTVTDSWGTGAYVTASVLRGAVPDSFGPSRALGIAHAAVDPGDKALRATLDAPDTVPGQEGVTEITVTVDGLGESPGYVTLAAVDLGILNLTGFDAPDPSGHYFGQRRLGVELRDFYGRLIDTQSGSFGAIRSGGDAGTGMTRQGPPPTEAVMAAFSGVVTLDANGTATIPIPRPDFNGTIRLMAMAWSADGVGNASTDIIARDPVVISAALPRFMAPGDESRLQLEFVHAAGTSGTMPLSVNARGVTLGAAPATITLADKGTTRVSLPLTADALGDHQITASLTTPDGAVLTKSLTIGTRANDPATAVTRRLTLAAGQTLTLDDNVFAGLRAGATATVSAGPLSRFDVPGLLRQLDRYPYGCTEQITSAALPLLHVADLAQGVGLTDLDQRIDSAIRQILTRQSSSGSFGLWGAGSGDFWLDAYVTDFLSQARADGHTVPDTAMTLALDNLRNRVNYAPDFDTGGEALAYALLVLSRAGAAQIGDLRYYADAKATAFATPLARAQLGAALAQYGEQSRADAMFSHAMDLALGTRPSGPLWRADYGTALRDAAGLLHLGTVAGSARIDRAQLSALISTPGRTLSTQEAVQVVMAASAMSQPGTTSDFTLNGAAVTGPVVTSHAAGQASAALQNTSATDQEVTLTTYGTPQVLPEATGYGYALTRRAYDLDGNPADGPWTIGERRVIVLEVTPFEAVGARLMVDDPLPAGLEIDNPNLLRAGDVRALDWLKPASAQHAEFRTDRFLAAVDHRSDDSFRLAYIARAVSPGDFHHPAALVHDMYRPEYRAITDAGRVTVTE